MRFAPLLAVLCVAVIPSFGAISIVQTKTACTSSNSTTLNCAFASNTASGNAVGVCLTQQSKSNTVSSVTGLSAGAWTQAKRQAGGNSDFIEIWVGSNTGVGTTVTITYSGKGTNGANMIEIAGLDTSSIIDQTNGQETTSSTIDTGNITTTVANDLLMGCANPVGGTYSSGPSNSFTDIEHGSNRAWSGYRIVSATGTYNTTWVITTSQTTEQAIASFKCTGCGGGGGAVLKDIISRGIIPIARFKSDLDLLFWPWQLGGLPR